MVVLSSSINFSAKAQGVYEPGKSYFSAGYGFGNFVQAEFSIYQTYNDYSFKSLGPIFGKYEFAVNEQLGIGVVFAYASANVSYTDDSVIVSTSPIGHYKEQIDWSSFSILLRMNWHFNSMGDRLDPYLGFGFGYRGSIRNYSDNDPNYNNNISQKIYFPVGMEVTAGLRFMASDFLGFYTEVGLAKAVFQVGIVTKF